MQFAFDRVNPKSKVKKNKGRSKNKADLGSANIMVRKGGLEPPRFYPPDPKSGASANSATFAALLDYTKQVFVEEVFSDLSNYKA
jgi:hypothetical protein